MNKENLIEELAKINIILSNEQFEQINTFCLFLLEENKKYNLTAIKDYDEVLLKHVYDSLTLGVGIDLMKCDNLLDIGSGAGFPGIIIKIVFPHLHVTLLDSNGKKTKFLEQVKLLLNLNNLDIITARAEDYIKNCREAYDLVTARAVANLTILLELAIPFIKVNGFFIAMKGCLEKELVESQNACSVLSCQIVKVIDLILPVEMAKRSLIVIEKKAKTDMQYPRRYDQILKKPLKINKK